MTMYSERASRAGDALPVIAEVCSNSRKALIGATIQTSNFRLKRNNKLQWIGSADKMGLLETEMN